MIIYGWGYFNRRNQKHSRGKCPNCGLRNHFKSYTSTRYATLYFLPLFPTGKFRIIEECESCKNASRLSYGKWRKIQKHELPEMVQSLHITPGPNRREEIIASIEAAILAEDEDALEKIVAIAHLKSSDDIELVDWAAYAYEHLLNPRKSSELYLRLSELDEKNSDAYLKLAESVITLSEEIPPKPQNPALQRLPVLIVPAFLLFGCLQLLNVLFFQPPNNVYAVNGTSEPYEVLINQEQYLLPPGQAVSVTLHYGDVEVQPTAAEINIKPFTANLSVPLMERLFSSAIYVINPDQIALIIETRMPYITEGKNIDRPSEIQIHVGEQFQKISEVDYPFFDPPDTIEMPADKDVIYKTHLEVSDIQPPLDVIQGLANNDYLDAAIEFSRHYSTLKPNNSEVIHFFTAVAPQEEAIAHLREHLEDRPINIEWHRAYQQIHLAHDNSDALIKEYQNLIEQSPQIADMYYLRGRISKKRSEGKAYFQKALDLDSMCPYAHYAMAWHYMEDGDFSRALNHIRICLDQAPDNTGFHSIYRSLLIATKNWESLVIDLPKVDHLSELSYQDFKLLLTALAGSGKMETAQSIVQEYVSEIHEPNSEDANLLTEYLQFVISEICENEGDISKYLQQNEVNSLDKLKLYLLQKDYKSAIAECDSIATNEKFLSLMFIRSLALLEYQQDFVKSCDLEIHQIEENLGIDETQIRQILYSESKPDLQEVLSISAYPENLRIILFSIGAQHPEVRRTFWAHAKKMNFNPDAQKVLLDKFI